MGLDLRALRSRDPGSTLPHRPTAAIWRQLLSKYTRYHPSKLPRCVCYPETNPKAFLPYYPLGYPPGYPLLGFPLGLSSRTFFSGYIFGFGVLSPLAVLDVRGEVLVISLDVSCGLVMPPCRVAWLCHLVVGQCPPRNVAAWKLPCRGAISAPKCYGVKEPTCRMVAVPRD